MKSDLFIRNLLIIIVILLALNIILPILSNPATSYAAKNIEYKVLNLDLIGSENFDNHDPYYPSEYLVEPIEKAFNEYAKEGWEYVGSVNLGGLAIFKR